MKKKRAYIGILISIIFIYFSIKDVDLPSVWQKMSNVNWHYITFSLMALFLGLILKACRWRILLKPIKFENFKNIFSTMMTAYFGDCVLPARMGELIRIFFASTNYQYSKVETAGTILVEKLLDCLILLCFSYILLLSFPFHNWFKEVTIILSIIVPIIIIILFFFDKRSIPGYVYKLLMFGSVKVNFSIVELLQKLGSGIGALKTRKSLSKIVMLSTVIWLTDLICVAFVLRSMNLHLSWLAPLTITTIVNLGMVIPSSPGYLGSYQGLCILALSPFGIFKDTALSFSIILHALFLSTSMVIGSICFIRENVQANKGDLALGRQLRGIFGAEL